MATHHTYRVLYEKYLALHPDHQVSMGTLRKLKPFYVRAVTSRDLEMCCCKEHLHARRMVTALLGLLGKYSIASEEFCDYYSFFSYLTLNCKTNKHTHIGW